MNPYKKGFLEEKVSEDLVKSVKDISMDKVIHLSFKALDKIIPYMIEGYKYNEACEKAGYDFKKIKIEKETTNPVVNRAIAQFKKVLNSIIREYKTFDQINIELSRIYRTLKLIEIR
ncbi:MAG: hypothetical protein MZU84_03795 [Sphingobacterium sp.]|nr:hypothetical protein [Sphingobacterium sp.]